MLLNHLGKIVQLGKVKDYGVKYNPDENAFEGEKTRDVRLYETLRKDLVEIHVARAYPKNGMFSLEQRAHMKQA